MDAEPSTSLAGESGPRGSGAVSVRMSRIVMVRAWRAVDGKSTLCHEGAVRGERPGLGAHGQGPIRTGRAAYRASVICTTLTITSAMAIIRYPRSAPIQIR